MMCILSIPPQNIKKQIKLNYKLKQYIREVYLIVIERLIFRLKNISFGSCVVQICCVHVVLGSYSSAYAYMCRYAIN